MYALVGYTRDRVEIHCSSRIATFTAESLLILSDVLCAFALPPNLGIPSATARMRYHDAISAGVFLTVWNCECSDGIGTLQESSTSTWGDRRCVAKDRS